MNTAKNDQDEMALEALEHIRALNDAGARVTVSSLKKQDIDIDTVLTLEKRGFVNVRRSDGKLRHNSRVRIPEKGRNRLKPRV